MCALGWHADRLEHLHRTRVLPNYEPEKRVYVCMRCGRVKVTETEVIFSNNQPVFRSREKRVK